MLKLIAASIFLTASSSASAQWIATKNENPFDNSETHFAVTAASQVVLGFRCATKGEDPMIILLLPDEGSEAEAERLSILKPEIAVIVDADASVGLPSVVESIELDGRRRLRLRSVEPEQSVALARRMAAAKRRIAVAASMGGKTFYATVLGVSGSRRAIGGAIDQCGIKPSS